MDRLCESCCYFDFCDLAIPCSDYAPADESVLINKIVEEEKESFYDLIFTIMKEDQDLF